MALVFAQTDTNQSVSACNTAAELLGCSGRSADVGGMTGQVCVSGGTLGTTIGSWSVAASATDVAEFAFICTVDSGVSWDAGTWTIRFNVTTANMNLTVTEIHLCRVSSTCVNQASLGSATGLSISLGTTGVKSQDISGSAATPGAGDIVLVVFVITNGAMSGQTASVTYNQNIDSPFTAAAATTFLWDYRAAIRPHLVRKVREFLGGLVPPKLAPALQRICSPLAQASSPSFYKKAA